MMDNELDYYKALEQFLTRMAGINAIVREDVPLALGPMCQILRIARMEIISYDNPKAEMQQLGNKQVLYSEEEWDTGRILTVKEMTPSGDIFLYGIFQRKEESDWTKEEDEKIKFFQRMLFTFQSKVRVTQLLNQRTFFDEGLGIHNHRFFMRRVSEFVERGEVQTFGYCRFNLKHFSLVNERLGRVNGTIVMKRFITGLQELITPPGTVCRIGGDNFIVFFVKGDLDRVRSYLHGALISHGENPEEQNMISASAGYYIPSGVDMILGATDVMDRVSMAEGIARSRDELDEVSYDEDLKNSQAQVKAIEDMFPRALKDGEFQVFYQPKVGLRDYRLNGGEALCRWIRNGVMIAPDSFIPALERSTRICDLDFHMLELVCRDIRSWLDKGLTPVRISVNLSRRHLGDIGLVKRIMGIIDSYRVPHEYIEIELTETTTDVEFKDLRTLVSALHKENVCTSVDDFGTGYSSLNLIRDIPWDVLKLDKCFLPTMISLSENDESSESIMLRHLLSMAHDLGLECIVEGVESREHVRLLKDNKCFMAQGFYFDKPMPKEKFEERLGGKNECYSLLESEIRE